MGEPPVAESPSPTETSPDLEPKRPDIPPEHQWGADSAAFLRKNLKIATKSGGLVPFEPNHTQKVVLRAISEMRAMGLPPRIMVLKSRQVGISTLSIGLLFMFCTLLANRSGLVLAHTEKLARTLLRMARRFLANLPNRPKKKFENVREIHFEKNDSRIQVEAVGEVRGYTAQDCLISEFAFYDDAGKTLDAIMQAVPNIIDSLVVIESTANGVGNKFYEMWKQAVEDWGQNSKVPLRERGFYPIFIPWYKHREYVIDPWFTYNDLTVREYELQKAFKLSLEQIAWRRWCIKTNCDNSEDTFAQEYPATWKDGFRLTGRPIIDEDAFEWLEEQALKPEQRPKPHELEYNEEEKRWGLIYVPKGRGHEYEARKDRHTYIIGADLSEGDKRSDYSPLTVLDQMTLNHVYTWSGRLPPEQLAHVADDLSRYYFGSQGPAQIINEANNQGINFHTELIERLHHPNIYFRRTSEKSVAGKITMKPGFLTGNDTRHFLFNSLRRWVHTKYRDHREEPIFSTQCPILIGEILGLVYVKPDGQQDAPSRIENQAGRYKDHAVSFALTLVAHRGSMALPLEPIPEEEFIQHATSILALGERNREAADIQALDILHMTCDQITDELDRMAGDEKRRNRFGGMV